jgi:5'-nucleotidase
MDHVHLAGAIKAETLANLSKYIRKEPRLAQLLKAIRAANCKSFLLTNSEWYYTEKVMSYLLDDQWRSYFDIVIVSANKPKFFEEGTTLREVDIATGQLKLGSVRSFQPTSVYAGGGIVTFQKLAGIPNGDQVLYIGDHIFADIIRSKKVWLC